MISNASNVSAYIAELPAERRASIEKLRALCRRHLTGYEEAMEYGMPAYKRAGVMEISFASQKQYVAVYVLKKDVVDEFRDVLPKQTGKGCIRFRPDRVDFAVVEQILRRTAESSAEPC